MIRIASSVEFGKLITALSSDVVDANIHWRLYCDLHEAIKAQPIVWAQSRTFWQMTLNAHAETAIEHLCRVFDQEESAFHMLSWLKTIKKYIHLFDTVEFKRRLADNPFVDSLAEDSRSPDLVVLETDINDCTKTNLLVKRLMVHRANAVAHRSAKQITSDKPLPLELTLSIKDLEALLSRARTVLNRYSQLFAAETYSVSMIGCDDYKYIFTSIASAVERSRDAAWG